MVLVAGLLTFCGFCRMAKRLLGSRGIRFATHDVTGDSEGRRWLMERSGQRTVPQIFIHGRSVGGYQELAQLDRTGGLREALLEG